jgi:hypothetical protein
LDWNLEDIFYSSGGGVLSVSWETMQILLVYERSAIQMPLKSETEFEAGKTIVV